MVEIRPTAADYCCIVPGVQQVIAAADFVYCVTDIIYELARGLLTKTWYGDRALYARWNEIDWDHIQSADLEAIKSQIVELPYQQVMESIEYIFIDFLRFIPVIGTLYSLARVMDKLKVRFVPEHPWIDNHSKVSINYADGTQSEYVLPI